MCHCSYHIKLKGTEFPVVHFKITTQSWRYTVCAIFKSRKIFYFLVTIKVSPRRLWFLRALSINIINVNESDPRSNEHYLGSSENKALKKISGLCRIWTYFHYFHFHYCSSSVHYCEDHFHSRLYPQFKKMIFIYSQPFNFINASLRGTWHKKSFLKIGEFV